MSFGLDTFALTYLPEALQCLCSNKFGIACPPVHSHIVLSVTTVHSRILAATALDFGPPFHGFMKMAVK